ncbi:MAG TPA: cyclic nucleotide-binding domain-containing protein, partial [Magnetospirillum sp.]|nr:cyclic nucleotide-binding domain-containing protein [Magnetospirillum sp.]
LAFVFVQPVGGVLATSGLVVAVLGLALRGIIADVFSGIALNMEHPFRVGDWVQLDGGLVGMVTEMNWRATRLVTRDHTAVVVPNAVIAGSRLVNFSYPDRHYRAVLRLALPAGVPVERARRLLLSAVLGVEAVQTAPRPEVQVEGFDERGVMFAVRYWVADFADDNHCRDAVAAAVAETLAHAGLAPGVPRREVMVGRRPDGAASMGLEDHLRQVPLFRRFSAEEISALAVRVSERPFREGECLFAQNDPGGSLLLVAEGVLEVRVRVDGGETALERMLSGDVLGEISLLTGQPRSASAVALTDGLAYEIRKDHLEPILRARPQLAEELADLMARRQAHNRERLAAGKAKVETQAEAGDLLARLKAFFRL